MIFETLTLANFGVFNGSQRFDLAPRVKYGSRRPIILFGGLNGSGKTSVLTAIRLVLHGRQALGFGTSQKKYESLLLRLFHRDSTSRKAANQMSVRLDFTYSSLGGVTKYAVERSWHQNKKAISEHFSILADGKGIESSDPDQAQAFLTQLVPVGVADLFFFDGEKIADLASEDSGSMLAESIGRLLGLDVISKLRSDLDVYERRQGRKTTGTDDSESQLNLLFGEIEKSKAEVDARYQKIRQEIEPAISSVRIDLDKLEGRLAERGGAWAVSRDAFRQKLDELVQRKAKLEDRIREMAADILPLALAPIIGAELVGQLESERKANQRLDIGRLLEQKRSALSSRLSKLGVKSCVDDVIRAITSTLSSDEKHQHTTTMHDLGESDSSRLINAFSISLPTVKEAAKVLRREVATIDEELAFVSRRIAAAPSEEQLKDDFEMVKKANQALGDLLARKRLLLEEVRGLVWRQIELVRRIKRDYAHVLDHTSQKEIAHRVTAIKGALDTFSNRLVARKTELLAEHFMQSFRQLIRKDSLVSSAEVDPKSLALKLIDANGDEIQKAHLSAGERQLFAVAMLDALAKTSGRSIPIIIDTPLGRLDSRHRTNLVKHYLPYASHQVVVLSTDTEVDERFFYDLGSSVSHAYYLDFDEESRSTVAREGYFWRNKPEGTKHAA